MRILVVQESDWVKRGPHQQHHLFERLSELGHKIRVIDYEIDWKSQTKKNLFTKTKIFNVKSKSITGQTIEVVRPFLVKAPVLSYISIAIFHPIEVIRQIKSFKPDVIIGFGVLNAFFSVWVSKMYRIPFVYYLIDSLHRLIPEKIFQTFGKFLEHKTLKRADFVLTINRRLGDYAKRLGASGEMEIITAGVDKSRFNPEVDGKNVRKLLSIANNKLVIFFMGWLYDFSGLKEIAHSLVNETSDIHLLVLGRGELEEELNNLVKNKSIASITLVGWVPYSEVPEYIAAANICILPAYLNEVMRNIVPIKLYEYLACGKPVITTKLPGVVTEFGNSSGIVYVDNANEVTSKAMSIWRNTKLFSKLCDDALDFSKSLDWGQITNKFLLLLQSIIQKNKMRHDTP